MFALFEVLVAIAKLTKYLRVYIYFSISPSRRFIYLRIEPPLFCANYKYLNEFVVAVPALCDPHMTSNTHLILVHANNSCEAKYPIN